MIEGLWSELSLAAVGLDRRVDQVLAQIAAMPCHARPPGTRSLRSTRRAALAGRPSPPTLSPFLSVRPRRRPLVGGGPGLSLIEAEARCPTAGGQPDALGPAEVTTSASVNTARSSVDWNFACSNSVVWTLGFWLPSLGLEGGPSPEQILPVRARGRGLGVRGFFGGPRAGLPVILDAASHVRTVQRQQLTTALPWAVRASRSAYPTRACET